MVSVNILKNDIGAEQAQTLAAILKEHATLKSLCGNKGDETELDMSSKMSGAGDAIMLVPEIVANGALTTLNISNNNLTLGALKAGSDGMEDDAYETDMTGTQPRLGAPNYTNFGAPRCCRPCQWHQDMRGFDECGYQQERALRDRQVRQRNI